MASEDSSYHFGFKSVFRLLLFALLVYFLISYFSQNSAKKHSQNDPTVLGEELDVSPIFDQAYRSLPPQSRQKLENISTLPVIIYLQEKYDYLLKELNGFPQKQINQLKKDLIQSIYNDLMKNIDEPQQP
ncbi:hypothetical protein KJ909_03160 [Patescibacteria group bacterium]|nr:hypothetical protein [Patescibacteria group bacterium]